MNEQWKELKETIIEIRDNNEFEREDVTLLCQFLTNYMNVLEKDASLINDVGGKREMRKDEFPIVDKLVKDSVNEVLDKIRAEIDAARFLDKENKLCKNANASGLEVAMDIIDKYKAERSE